MTDEVPEKIVISRQDVDSRKVDEVLAQQMSFGTPAQAKLPERSAWYYKSWFVLMMAGALGAFLAWALVEPFFDDGVRVKGNVQSVEPDAMIPGAPQVRGSFHMSGITVWVLSDGGTMETDEGTRPLSAAAIPQGTVVEVIGAASDENQMVAQHVVLQPGDQERYPRPDLSSLQTRQNIIGFLLFPFVAAFVGLMIGGADAIISRAWLRAVIGAVVGLGLGIGAGLVLTVIGGILYSILSGIAQRIDTVASATKMSAGAFMVQMMGRGLAWAMIGPAMGMGPGIVLRSKKLFVNGLIGGIVGGLLGGLLFDPINYALGGGQFGSGAESSRMVGLTCIGCATGLMVGIVELIARESWLKMLAGPLAGKEFVIYKDPTTIGSSPKREVYLFKDPDVEPEHARIVRSGEAYEIEDQKTPSGTFVNGRKISRQRLRNQDQIRIGSTVLLFTMKED